MSSGKKGKIGWIFVGRDRDFSLPQRTDETSVQDLDLFLPGEMTA
jgi:hypothetical protein